MPCKHMLTIMDNIDCVSLPSFSEKSRLSPFFRLDNAVVNENGIANQPIEDSILKIILKKSSQRN